MGDSPKTRWVRTSRWVGAHVTVLAKLGFSILAAGLLAMHLFSKSIRLDYVAVLLLILITAPWLLQRIAKLKAGDWEIDLRDLDDRIREVKDESAHATETQLPEQPAGVVPTESRPELRPRDFASFALELRLQIEMLVRELAAAARVGFGGGRFVLPRALRRLAQMGVLPPDLASALSELIPSLNSGVHGELVPPDMLDWISSSGQDMVDALSQYVAGYKSQSVELEAAIHSYVSAGTAAKVDYRVSDIRWAQDSQGVWWATALVDGVNLEIEQALVIMRRDPTTDWSGVDFGTGLEESEMPFEVRRRLWQR